MKVIINLPASSAYSVYNKHTFPLSENCLGRSIATIALPHSSGGVRLTDFHHKEIIIVDFQEELQRAYDNHNWGLDDSTYANLMSYALLNNIVHTPPKYNCPA